MSRARRTLVVFLLCVFAVIVPRAAMAACERPNLLSGVETANAPQLTDGVVAGEGTPWPDRSVAFAASGPLTWDLGQVERIGPVFFQADADQPIDLETSIDGASWTKQKVPPHPSATGMIGRIIGVRRAARYVRLSASGSIRPWAVTEVIAACADVPAQWTPPVRVAGDSERRAAEPSSADLSPGAVDALKLAIIGMAIALVVTRRTKGRLLAGVAALAALAYFEFGAFHRPAFVHEHDAFHYVIGSRYFPEVGYDGLYDCATAAEAEAGFTARISLRAQRDLRTNALVQGTEILARADECRARFGDARWKDFTRDVRSFASHRDVNDWHRILKDHGFNATPTWIAASTPFSRWGSSTAFDTGTSVAFLDPLLLVVAFAALFWAFGREVGCIAIIAFACNPLADFAYLGGAFLRQLWLASLLVGLALLAKRRGIAAGVALAFAAVLQLFPVVCLVGLAAAAVFARLRTKTFDDVARRALVAAALTIAIALPVSAAMSGRAGAWPAFIDNTAKHAATPSANLVGLPTVLSFRPSTRADVLFDERAVDPFAKVRAARKENFAPLRPLHFLAVALAAFAIVRRYRLGKDDDPLFWSSALAIALVPIALETSSYYTSFLVVTVLLARDTRRLLALPALGAMALVSIARLGGLMNDVYFAVASIVLVVAVGALLFFANRPAEEPAS